MVEGLATRRKIASGTLGSCRIIGAKSTGRYKSWTDHKVESSTSLMYYNIEMVYRQLLKLGNQPNHSTLNADHHSHSN